MGLFPFNKKAPPSANKIGAVISSSEQLKLSEDEEDYRELKRWTGAVFGISFDQDDHEEAV
ncbi:hypothetical protein D3C74_216590 [compost metagenome]